MLAFASHVRGTCRGGEQGKRPRPDGAIQLGSSHSPRPDTGQDERGTRLETQAQRICSVISRAASRVPAKRAVLAGELQLHMQIKSRRLRLRSPVHILYIKHKHLNNHHKRLSSWAPISPGPINQLVMIHWAHWGYAGRELCSTGFVGAATTSRLHSG